MAESLTIRPLGDAWPWPQVSDAFKAGDPAWFETTAERWTYALEVLPPVYFRGGFLMGEPSNSDARGWATYAAFVVIGRRYFVREVPLDKAATLAAELRDGLPAAVLA